MKKFLLAALITVFTNIPAISADKAAIEDKSTPPAHGPLDASSISIPNDAMPKSTTPTKSTLPNTSPLETQTTELPISTTPPVSTQEGPATKTLPDVNAQ